MVKYVLKKHTSSLEMDAWQSNWVYPREWGWFVFYVENPLGKERMDPENFNSPRKDYFINN
jgi:hypothetical protein